MFFIPKLVKIDEKGCRHFSIIYFPLLIMKIFLLGNGNQ
ncbi:hypothetical protein RV07_GL003976 [Enterococcus malodoratus]|nr:hypothetical protein RV07_GL003976 [Enterococcus malodoratus]